MNSKQDTLLTYIFIQQYMTVNIHITICVLHNVHVYYTMSTCITQCPHVLHNVHMYYTMSTIPVNTCKQQTRTCTNSHWDSASHLEENTSI